MNSRVHTVEKNLNIPLPEEYKNFIENVGVISDERGEVFGFIEPMDINKIPSVVAATKLYKEDYTNISNKDVVISFDELKNNPIVIESNSGNIYRVSHTEKKLICSNFSDWLLKYIGASE